MSFSKLLKFLFPEYQIFGDSIEGIEYSINGKRIDLLLENKKFNKYFNKLRPLIDSLPIRFYKNRTKTLFSPSFLPFSNIVDKINFTNRFKKIRRK